MNNTFSIADRSSKFPEADIGPETAGGNCAGSSNAHLLSIIPRGEVIRNFVHSGCLDLVADEAKVSLLSVTVGSELADVDSRGTKDLYALDPVEERWPVRFQREILDLAHGRWLWSKAAQERWRVRDHEARTIRRRAIRSIKKLLALPFANDLGIAMLSRSERFCSRLLNPTQDFIELYRSIKPTLVFNGSHIHSAIATPAIQAAQWLGIPTATFIFSWDNLTSQGRIMLPYEYFLVWNDDLKQQLTQMYRWIRPENVFVTGTPQFDHHFRPEFYWSREKFCSEVGADSERPIVLYSTGMANHMPGEPQIVESIADMLAEYGEDRRPQLLVRVYAKDLTGRFDELKDRRKDIIFQRVEWDPSWQTPKYADSYGLINALRHCSVGINIASTLSLELCMFDKPVINVAYDPPGGNDRGLKNSRFYSFEHYKPVADCGAVDLADSPEAMNELIRACLADPGKRSKQRRELISKMFGTTLDGRSATRVANVLLDLSCRGEI